MNVLIHVPLELLSPLKKKSQQIGLEKYKADSAMDRNAEIISNTLEQYLKEGYKVETSNIAEFGGALITTYILTK